MPDDLAAMLPTAAVVPGWTLVQPARVFVGERIFDYMDGAGEIPRSYGFRQLASAKYRHGPVVLEVALFEMDTSADAFGYFSARSFLERSATSPARIVMLDHPARLNDHLGVLTLWKDRYTVILQPDNGAPAEADLVKFARLVTGRIRGLGAPPELLKRLPAAGRVTGTERYIRGKAAFDATVFFTPADAFGMSGGAQAVAAEYSAPGGPVTVFVIQYASPAAGAAALGRLGPYLASRHARPEPGAAHGTLVVTDRREKGVAVAARGRHLAGVTRARDAGAAVKALARVEAGL